MSLPNHYKTAGPETCCPSCGIEHGYPTRCDSCEWRAEHELGEFVIRVDGKPLAPVGGGPYVFRTVAEAERMARICYPDHMRHVTIAPKEETCPKRQP